jgi:prepilin signal peptidase PulO-like enzyme (type II secretory pathway)
MERLSTVSEADTSPPATTWVPPAWAWFAAAILAAGTVVRLGFSANSVAWALVQIMLVGVTAYDFANRRIKNAVTVPVSVLALILRALFERSAFVEVLVTGVVVFLAVLALALVLRGGLGMGDVKLAGMLGFLLGEKVLPALFIGTIAGGAVGAYLLTRSSARRATMAYGPYLALGGVLVILFSHPPKLI